MEVIEPPVVASNSVFPGDVSLDDDEYEVAPVICCLFFVAEEVGAKRCEYISGSGSDCS